MFPSLQPISGVVLLRGGNSSRLCPYVKAMPLREGRPKITTWEKMKKHMHRKFIPYNYTRVLYQQLQKLRQDTQSVDEYSSNFYALVAQNDLRETRDQLVARYTRGLHVTF